MLALFCHRVVLCCGWTYSWVDIDLFVRAPRFLSPVMQVLSDDCFSKRLRLVFMPSSCTGVGEGIYAAWFAHGLVCLYLVLLLYLSEYSCFRLFYGSYQDAVSVLDAKHPIRIFPYLRSRGSTCFKGLW